MVLPIPIIAHAGTAATPDVAPTAVAAAAVVTSPSPTFIPPPLRCQNSSYFEIASIIL